MAPAYGDLDRLLQVFGNLIGNAVKFTPRGIAAASARHFQLSNAFRPFCH